MAKRGRKPKEKKGYFYEDEEQAIVRYINEPDVVEKNKIFNNVLYPAFTKMIESIIRRYKLFVPDEEFEQNFNDTISYLLTKINHFKPTMLCYDLYKGKKENLDIIEFTENELKEKIKSAEVDDPDFIEVLRIDEEGNEISSVYKKTEHKYKAYSYCGTVCRNYLMYKCSQYYRKKLRNASYDDVYEEISNDEKFSTEHDDYASIAEKLIVKISNEIETMINDKESNGLTDNEITVGKSLVTLLRNWEEVLPENGSNKLQKSSILYFLREDTRMTTKEVRENMKHYKTAYKLLKSLELE